MRSHAQTMRRIATFVILFSILFPPVTASAQWPVNRIRRKDTRVETLAKKLDKVHNHVNEYGSVVAKSPDVWGESRLMRHRSDVERQLRARLDTFEFRINARQVTRDAALLAQAIALQGQLGTDAITLGTGDGQQNPASATAGLISDFTAENVIPRTGFAGGTTTFQGGDRIGIEPVVELDQLNRYLQHLNELRRLNEGDDTADSPGYSLNLIRIPVSILPGRKTRTGYGAEVEISIEPHFGEELLPIAFRDFVINGVKNRIGYQAFDIATHENIIALRTRLDAYYSGDPAEPDMSMGQTAAPAPNSETFEMSAPPKSFANATSIRELPRVYWEIGDLTKAKRAYEEISNAVRMKRSSPAASIQMNSLSGAAQNVIQRVREKSGQEILQDSQGSINRMGYQQPQLVAAGALSDELIALLDVEAVARRALPTGRSSLDFSSLAPSFSSSVDGHTLASIAVHLYESLVIPPVSGALINEEDRSENGLTYPATEDLLLSELRAAYAFLSRDSTRFIWDEFCTCELADQIREHRRLLPKSQRDHLLEKFSNGTISVDPRGGVHQTRARFFDTIENAFPQAKGSVMASLAWHVIVESALLNDRLVRDMKEVASTRNCACLPTHQQMFAGPNPPPESREAFKQYVKCRWPIHVFSVDPVTQDQNVADTFSRRQELQVVLALAASNRLLGGQSLTRFARRLEYDLETIALNRTAIGFSHGDNTFGWRFYPRIQAPPVPGHLQSKFSTLLGQGQDSDSLLKQSKLEAGMRECTALVVMPSFMPQLTVDVRTNWFALGGGTRFRNQRRPDFQKSVALSREIVQLRNLASICKQDEHLYRDGEVYRLCKAVERLDKRLPMQTHSVQVPWENNSGGFEMFNTGSGVLKPQLLGWYGAPGVRVNDLTVLRSALALVEQRTAAVEAANLELLVARARADEMAQTTTQAALTAAQAALESARTTARQLQLATGSTRLFLVGKNFSVLDTEVIAGGVDVTDSVRLLSRSLMSIEIPTSVSAITLNRRRAANQQHVVVNLMTPYGAASNRLLIPVQGDSPEAAVTAATVTAAIQTHVSDRHPISYVVNPPAEPVVGTVVMGAQHAQTFGLQTTRNHEFVINFADGEGIDKILNSTSQTGQLAVRMTVTSATSGTAAKTGLNVGPWNFTTGQKISMHNLVHKIEEVLRREVETDFNPNGLTLQPYVRFLESGSIPDRTIFKPAGTLSVRLTTVNAQAPPAVPSMMPNVDPPPTMQMMPAPVSSGLPYSVSPPPDPAVSRTR